MERAREPNVEHVDGGASHQEAEEEKGGVQGTARAPVGVVLHLLLVPTTSNVIYS